MPRYRVFCDEKQQSQFPEEVKILETYPAFSIIQATEAVVKKMGKKFPMEKLKSNSKKKSSKTLADLKSLVEDQATDSGLIRVQFNAPVKKAWLEKLSEAGSSYIDAFGESSVIIKCKGKKAFEAIGGHDFVKQTEKFKPAIKLGVEFVKGLRKGTSGTSGTSKSKKQIEKSVSDAAAALAMGDTPAVEGRKRTIPGGTIASFFTEADARSAQKALSALGVKTNYSAKSKRLIIHLNSAKDPVAVLKTLVQRKGLSRIEELKIPRLANDKARKILAKSVVESEPVSGRLTGKGEIVAVADSGLDTGNASTIHPDFAGRIVEIASFPIDSSFDDFITNPGGDDGPADTNSGHGTHVAGSVLGNGKRAEVLDLTQEIKGVAPEAKLVFQAIEQKPEWTPEVELEFLLSGQSPPKTGLFGIPENLEDLFQPAYDQGARIHNNSWGGGTPGDYDSQCEDLDRFVWNNKDFLVVVAAGNSGTDVSPRNGSIDLTSVDSPATAKNCLTVGASENNRKSQFTDTYGEWWPSDFSKNPIKTDSMTDNINDVVAFSSRGPCNTGRRKPDVIAPGTFVLSTRSSQIADNNFAWGAFAPAKKDYMYMGGTSMASPLVAGCAAVVRQFLRKHAGISKPSAALLKAAMIHSAQYKKYQFANPSSGKFADNEQGWGRVNIDSIIHPKDPVKVLFQSGAGLATGQAKEFDVKIEAGTPLRITMVYTDFPGEELVNNLNLIVTSPNGDFIFGNDFDGSGTPDNLNNVEGVVVSSPKAGKWNIKVVGSEVLVDTQDFALVVSGSKAKFV